MKRMKFTTYSGLPVKFARSAGFWVATPTGQVSRWQTRIITQPRTTRGAVAKPNSSAPRRAAIGDVAAGHELAVGLDGDARAQVVEQRGSDGSRRGRAPRAGPRAAWSSRRGAGAAVVAGDEDNVGAGLGDAGGYRADADLGDELDEILASGFAHLRSWMSSERSSIE